MKYWLYTEEYPDGEVLWGTWGIATVDTGQDEDDEYDDEVYEATIIDILIDTTGYLKPGFVDEVFDDSITEDYHDCVKFVFTRSFWS